MSPTADAILVDHRGRKYLTAEERTRFLAAVRSRPIPTVQTLTRTLALTGCRVSEALGIRACEVDLEANEIRIATLKRRRSHWRAVPIPEEAGYRPSSSCTASEPPRAAREDETARCGPSTRQTATRQVRELMHRAGITGPQAHPRGLRHSFGVAAVTAGVPLPTIAAILGHANLSAIGAEARELVARVWNTGSKNRQPPTRRVAPCGAAGHRSRRFLNSPLSLRRRRSGPRCERYDSAATRDGRPPIQSEAEHRGSSAHAKRRRRNENTFMPISTKRLAEIAAIADDDIDTSDVPEADEAWFQDAKQGGQQVAAAYARRSPAPHGRACR